MTYGELKEKLKEWEEKQIIHDDTLIVLDNIDNTAVKIIHIINHGLNDNAIYFY